MDILPIVKDAIAYASLIALGSIGITLTYLTTKVPNFAQGDTVLLGSYTALTVVQVLGINPYLSLPLAAIIGGLLGIVEYRVILKPATNRGATVVMLTALTLAIDLILLGFINVYADYLQTAYGILSRSFYLRNYDFYFAGVYGGFWVSIMLAILITFGLYSMMTKTNFGIAMRATVENNELASTMGINTERVRTVSWFISGAVATVAGFVLPLLFIVGPQSGFFLIITMFAGSVVGGLFSIYGAILGGYLVGMAEIIVTYFLSQTVGSGIISYRPAIPLLIMIAILFVAPRGIAGINLRSVFRRR
jgi:branched-chain amino acid transport system permease protein